MNIRLMRVSAGLLLLGASSAILSQTAPAIDSALYFSFFREAAGHVVPASQGEPTDLVPQSIQDAMGITDQEAKAVVDTATACDEEINALEASARALVFESRLRAANDEKP